MFVLFVAIDETANSEQSKKRIKKSQIEMIQHRLIKSRTKDKTTLSANAT